jgi:hypothetical protein
MFRFVKPATRGKIMGNPQTEVAFYSHGGVTVALIGIDGKYLSISELKAAYDQAAQADKALYGEVVVKTYDNLEDLNSQTIAVMPRKERIKKSDMERLIRAMLPANRTYSPKWHSNIQDGKVQLTLLVRQLLLG